MRSEGAAEIQAVEEALRRGREAHVPVEIFHRKVLGKARWGSMPKPVAMIQAARDRGQDVTANMYPYVAGETALDEMTKLVERVLADYKDVLGSPAVATAIGEMLDTFSTILRGN